MAGVFGLRLGLRLLVEAGVGGIGALLGLLERLRLGARFGLERVHLLL